MAYGSPFHISVTGKISMFCTCPSNPTPLHWVLSSSYFVQLLCFLAVPTWNTLATFLPWGLCSHCFLCDIWTDHLFKSWKTLLKCRLLSEALLAPPF